MIYEKSDSGYDHSHDFAPPSGPPPSYDSAPHQSSYPSLKREPIPYPDQQPSARYPASQGPPYPTQSAPFSSASAPRPPPPRTFAPFETITVPTLRYRLSDGFSPDLPQSYEQPHPFASHDITQEDWLAFLGDIRRITQNTSEERMRETFGAESSLVPGLGRGGRGGLARGECHMPHWCLTVQDADEVLACRPTRGARGGRNEVHERRRLQSGAGAHLAPHRGVEPRACLSLFSVPFRTRSQRPNHIPHTQNFWNHRDIEVSLVLKDVSPDPYNQPWQGRGLDPYTSRSSRRDCRRADKRAEKLAERGAMRTELFAGVHDMLGAKESAAAYRSAADEQRYGSQPGWCLVLRYTGPAPGPSYAGAGSGWATRP